jgi:O-methyltransferase
VASDPHARCWHPGWIESRDERYLELLARTLTRAVFEDDTIASLQDDWTEHSTKQRVADKIGSVIGRYGYELVRKQPYVPELRETGRDWPARAETMAGLRRLRNTRACIEQVLHDDVPGDLIETGVWRGGMTIFMRGVLKAYDVSDRIVWAADSFEGLPAPDVRHFPADAGNHWEEYDILSVGVEQVKHNFDRYGLLDEQVRFLVGWFKDTLPRAPIDSLAVLRLDGDMYESTIQALNALYPKLSPGGFCIIDDFGNVAACAQAVHEYRERHGITEKIIDIDGWGAFWRRDR